MADAIPIHGTSGVIAHMGRAMGRIGGECKRESRANRELGAERTQARIARAKDAQRRTAKLVVAAATAKPEASPDPEAAAQAEQRHLAQRALQINFQMRGEALQRAMAGYDALRELGTML